ncbi:hypothetical protein JT306_06140 [Salmonella enterica subsp. enterica serovar Kentucky]|nr:hypothetical protein [Salmonella enterica subsp. enterica serovar Kentucky]
MGGPAQITMPGSIVTLAGRSGDIMGCIGIKAYHFAKGDERTQPPALDKLWIDIGAKDKADAERMGIQVGTPVTLYNPPHCLGNDLVCSKALDDRLGCTALLGVAEALAPHRSISRCPGSRRYRKSSIFAGLFRFTTRAP